VTRTLALATFTMSEPEPMPLPPLPDFITTHIDPLSGDDDSADIDAGTGNILSRLPPLEMPKPALPAGVGLDEMERVSRNAPCPCGSGQKYKHCHGQLG
jgi:preprotein translocase subunit SecA